MERCEIADTPIYHPRRLLALNKKLLPLTASLLSPFTSSVSPTAGDRISVPCLPASGLDNHILLTVSAGDRRPGSPGGRSGDQALGANRGGAAAAATDTGVRCLCARFRSSIHDVLPATSEPPPHQDKVAHPNGKSPCIKKPAMRSPHHSCRSHPFDFPALIPWSIAASTKELIEASKGGAGEGLGLLLR
jgi:hypothetical protein